jgi:CheY-like chemotaxis protein
MRILIADDDRDAIMTLGILLRSEGHDVRATQFGVEVPEAVRDFKPELVLLDLAMPHRNGYELAEQLSREYGAACPALVAVTALSDPDNRTRAEISGFHHLIAKPYNSEEMLALVTLFGRRAAARRP